MTTEFVQCDRGFTKEGVFNPDLPAVPYVPNRMDNIEYMQGFLKLALCRKCDKQCGIARLVSHAHTVVYGVLPKGEEIPEE